MIEDIYIQQNKIIGGKRNGSNILWSMDRRLGIFDCCPYDRTKKKIFFVISYRPYTLNIMAFHCGLVGFASGKDKLR